MKSHHNIKAAASACVIALAMTVTPSAFAGDTPAPADAKVYFVSPANGDTVSNPIKVVMGLSGMGVAPAGTQKEKTGHHHLIIDAPTPGPGAGIASDEKHRHFGGGQTETTIELAPGQHTLQLVLGDWKHVPHNPPIASEVITITVK